MKFRALENTRVIFTENDIADRRFAESRLKIKNALENSFQFAALNR